VPDTFHCYCSPRPLWLHPTGRKGLETQKIPRTFGQLLPHTSSHNPHACLGAAKRKRAERTREPAGTTRDSLLISYLTAIRSRPLPSHCTDGLQFLRPISWSRPEIGLLTAALGLVSLRPIGLTSRIQNKYSGSHAPRIPEHRSKPTCRLLRSRIDRQTSEKATKSLSAATPREREESSSHRTFLDCARK
jgi:hypothetical protein